jgi:hypothetical protein
MFEFSTLFHRPSTEVQEAPTLPTGATLFWKDDTGTWQTVEVIDCEPRGWGFCCIEWDDNGKHQQSVPFLSLCDLDTYLDQCEDYARFLAAADGR